jgi:hypothetical protein
MTALTPIAATRQRGRIKATKEQMEIFCSDQFQRLKTSGRSGLELFIPICNLANMGTDISSIAVAKINSDIINIADFVKTISHDTKIFVPLQKDNFIDGGWQLQTSFTNFLYIDQENVVRRPYDFIFCTIQSAANDRGYNLVKGAFDNPEHVNSAYGTLIMALKLNGYNLQIGSPEVTIIGYYDGPDGGNHDIFKDKRLVHGVEIKHLGIIITVKTRRIACV